MKRKMTAAAVVCLIGVLLTGCGLLPGLKEKDRPAPGIEAERKESEKQGEGAAEKDNSAAGSTKPSAAAVQEEYVSGSLEDGEYVNESLGLRFTVPKGMTVLGAEQMKSLLEAGAGFLFEDEEASENAVEAVEDFTEQELAAFSLTGGSMILISVEKLPEGESGEAEYAEATRRQLEQTGGEMQFGQTSERTLGETVFTQLTMEYSVQGLDMKQVLLFKKMGDRMVTITAGGLTQEAVDEVLAGFSAY